MTDEKAMPFIEHLTELRSRLIKIVGAALVGFLVCYNMADGIFLFIADPLLEVLPEGKTLVGTGIAEAFMTKIKVSLIAAIFLASPFIFYQIWGFVSPGLYPAERNLAIPFVFFGTALFLAGIAFAYKVVFPLGLKFLIGQFAVMYVDPMLKIDQYLSSAGKFLLVFGIVFQMPLIAFFLGRIGILSHKFLMKNAAYALVIIVISAAVLTPPDVISQILLALPMVVLYAASIAIVWAFGKDKDDSEE